MNPEHKKYILENMAKKSPAEIASELGIKERNVKKFIRMEGRVSKPSGAATVTGPKISVKPVPVKKAMILASIALIIILGCAAYANSLNGKFVYDDEPLIKNNSFIENWSSLPKVFTEDIGKGAGKRYAFYRPIQIITYAIDYHVWKFNVVGYHLTSIILHILVALCIYWLINILFDDKIVSVLTAVLFVAHPIHTTVVSYISTRAESLYLLFLLLSFIFYTKSIHGKAVIPFLVMILSYTLALLSKENALILPALILLYHYTFKEKIRIKEFLSMAGLAFIYILLRTTALKHLIADVIPNGTLIQRIPGFFAAAATYVRLLFLPFGLHLEYGRKIFVFADPKVLAGLAILAGLTYCAFRASKTNRLIFFSLAWFLITLLPVSNIYPLNAYMSENWLYLPSVGFFLVLAGFLRTLYKKEKYRVPAMIFTACLLVFYSYLTFGQNQTWADPIRFYERVLKYVPDSSKAYNNLGIIYADAGKEEDGITMFKKAIEADFSNANAYYNLAGAYYKTGKNDEAVSMYNKAIELWPDYAAAYNNLGIAYYEMGKKEEAFAMYKRAVELNPDYADAYNNLGAAYYEMGKKEEAIPMYKKAMGLNPNDAKAYNNLGNAYCKTGKKEEAFAMYKKAIELNPDYAAAYNNLGLAYYEMGKKEKAFAMYKKAIELNPNYVDAYNNLGGICDDAGKEEDAIAMYKKAVETDPYYASAYYNLGRIYYKAGKEGEAISMYKKAVELNPNYAEAYNNLGIAYCKTGKAGEAISMHKKAIELNPDYAEAYNNLGNVYYSAGKKEEAVAILKKAIEKKPDNAEAYYKLGFVYYSTGKKEDALYMYKKAIAAKPNYVDAYNNLGAAYSELGMREDATAAFKKALEIDPDRADARRNLDAITTGSK